MSDTTTSTAAPAAESTLTTSPADHAAIADAVTNALSEDIGAIKDAVAAKGSGIAGELRVLPTVVQAVKDSIAAAPQVKADIAGGPGQQAFWGFAGTVVSVVFLSVTGHALPFDLSALAVGGMGVYGAIHTYLHTTAAAPAAPAAPAK